MQVHLTLVYEKTESIVSSIFRYATAYFKLKAGELTYET